MANIWEPMPKSFPKDDKIPFTGEVHLEHSDIIDEQSFEMSAIHLKPKKLTQLRDSFFIDRRRSSLNASSINENFDQNSASDQNDSSQQSDHFVVFHDIDDDDQSTESQ